MLSRNLPVKMTPRQVWRHAERVGADLVRRRNHEVMEMLKGNPPKGPANPPDLLVVSVDGGRLQDRARAPGSRWCEYKAGVVYRVTRTADAREGTRPDPEPECHWRFRTTLGERQASDSEKTCRDPEPETKTYVASTEKIDRFPRCVELEAKRRGLMEAHEVAFIGDGGSFVWRTSKEACEDRRARGKTVYEILDIIHANEHLVAAAKAAYGPASSGNGVKWLNARLDELWAGEAEKLIAALERKAKQFGPRRPDSVVDPTGPRPERGEKSGEPLAEGETNLPPLVVLWRAFDYFDDNRERIRYDEFRKRGLPLASSQVESAIGQTNERVKAAKKSWFLDHADEMLALRTQALSEDGRWDDYFGKLRRGEIEIPTRGRMERIPVFPFKMASPMEPAA
jgi:hypothetical protein